MDARRQRAAAEGAEARRPNPNPDPNPLILTLTLTLTLTLAKARRALEAAQAELSAGHVEMRDLPPTQRAALRAQRLAHRLLREG